MSAAVFIDNDGRYTYVRGYQEYDLGHYRPDKYIWAGNGNNRQQLCASGGFRGNTLSWPGGKILGYKDATDALGRPFHIPQYDDLPDTEVLAWLSRATKARAYKSRRSFERHYAPAYDE